MVVKIAYRFDLGRSDLHLVSFFCYARAGLRGAGLKSLGHVSENEESVKGHVAEAS